jgi:hypothetical protein
VPLAVLIGVDELEADPEQVTSFSRTVPSAANVVFTRAVPASGSASGTGLPVESG